MDKLQKLEKVANLLKTANHVAVLTGAGISAESGVPTFRGAGGHWIRWKSQDLASPHAFRENPRLVWEFYSWRREMVRSVKPNAGHFALAELEQMLLKTGKKLDIVTQNVDDLHRRAGSTSITKLHGDLFSTRCTKCDKCSENYDEPVHSSYNGFVKGKDPCFDDIDMVSDVLPEQFCSNCGYDQVIRPDIVWFGEGLNADNIRRAENAVANCDLCFVIGTSSVVYPAAGFTESALRRGIPVVEVNPNPAAGNGENNLIVVDAKSGEFLPRLLEKFKN